jgi:hypothetical protein
MQYLSDGTISSAVERNGVIDFFIDTGDAIIKKSQATGRKTLSPPVIVSYAEEYAETQNSKISLIGNNPEIEKL